MKQETLRIPSELLKEPATVRHPMQIGIPKENQKTEKRLAFTPEAVDMLVEAGHKIIFEAGAGQGVRYSDAHYSEAGAAITGDRSAVFACDLIFKIAPPTLEEIGWMKKRATVLSLLQMPDISTETIKAMAVNQIHAVGYELMSPDGYRFPVRHSISEIEGAAAVSVASELLSNEKGGKGILLGGIPGVSPTEIVIIGAGVAGTTAARAALALGATVKVFDSDIDKLRQLQHELGTPVFTSVFQPNVLLNTFESADAAIGAMRYIDDSVRYVISEDVIRRMKKSSVVIDLRINQGGCFETTCFLPPEHPAVFEKYGILHYCVPNLSSRVARTTAMALSNIFIPLIQRMGELGGVTAIASADTNFRSGFYMYAGKPVNSYVAKYFNLPAHDIGLFLSVF
ncbi:MAG: alanine dehydrogenase [Dysgonamonadaceae bacterium]|jgi:alanine dehydrogenase|nr:alanine dehydrogenase [Dysgonamonadaceae bacterium]